MRNSKQLKRIILRGFLLLLPLMVVLGVFVLRDPMRCFYNYSSPLEKGIVINDRIFQTRWLKKKLFPYNAFIFGSSRAKSFSTAHWQQTIDSACPFHMAVNDETIYGIARKMEFLDREGYKIRYALLVLDQRILIRPENPDAHVFREHPDVSGENPLAFYQRFLFAFLEPSFLKAYLDYECKGTMDENFFFLVNFQYNPTTGDHLYQEYEKDLQVNENRYYSIHAQRFYDRSYSTNYKPEAVIGKKSLEELNAIKKILEKQRTDYRIVISPNYDQKKLHPADLKLLQEVFDCRRVFDYSGRNRFTCDIRHYYEEKHFRPFIADSILRLIY